MTHTFIAIAIIFLTLRVSGECIMLNVAGRLDRKIEIPLPNDQSRLDILKIHSNPITKHGEIDFEAVVKLSDGFNGADLRNVCTEAGLFAIRAEREYVLDEDFMKAVRKVAETKKLETKLDYKPV